MAADFEKKVSFSLAYESKVIVFVLKVLALITCFSVFDVDGTLDLS